MIVSKLESRCYIAIFIATQRTDEKQFYDEYLKYLQENVFQKREVKRITTQKSDEIIQMSLQLAEQEIIQSQKINSNLSLQYDNNDNEDDEKLENELENEYNNEDYDTHKNDYKNLKLRIIFTNTN